MSKLAGKWEGVERAAKAEFVSIKRLEFVGYFRSLKGKFGFYLTSRSISAMLNKCILLFLLFISTITGMKRCFLTDVR